MNENNRESSSERELSDDEEPILLTDEVPSFNQDEEAVIELDDSAGGDSAADGDTNEDGIGIALSYSLTPEKVDRALERTVEKLYGQRIESLLVEVVQNKVSTEIEKIKESLLDD